MADVRGIVSHIWISDGLAARAARKLLLPFSALYRLGSAVRGKSFDSGLLSAHPSSIPVISVGNLTVGGTGKTPVAAWVVSAIQERGWRAAVIVSGYADDEPMVHARLNPDAPVVISRDRMRGIREAVACGAEAVVLDDAFQHRRAARDADILLVSADGWTGRVKLLPAGPWRESLGAARRASLIIITRKTASGADVAAAERAVACAAPGVPIAHASLELGDLNGVLSGSQLSRSAIKGLKVLAIASVANPEAFFAQVVALGATVIQLPFPDHHKFTAREVSSISERSQGADYVVCTLKDAVKLENLWPAASTTLWYFSQHLRIEKGLPEIDALLDRVIS